MSVLANFAIFPLDKGTSVSPYIARAVRIIKESGLPYELGPMTTVIEGEWDEVMAVIDRCFKDLQRDAGRIYMTLNIDYRQGRTGGMTEKVAAVERKL